MLYLKYEKNIISHEIFRARTLAERLTEFLYVFRLNMSKFSIKETNQSLLLPGKNINQ